MRPQRASPYISGTSHHASPKDTQGCDDASSRWEGRGSLIGCGSPAPGAPRHAAQFFGPGSHDGPAAALAGHSGAFSAYSSAFPFTGQGINWLPPTSMPTWELDAGVQNPGQELHSPSSLQQPSHQPRGRVPSSPGNLVQADDSRHLSSTTLSGSFVSDFPPGKDISHFPGQSGSAPATILQSFPNQPPDKHSNFNKMGSQDSPPTPTESEGSERNPSPGPSEATSETSVRDRRKNVEPPKGADGKLYCEHAECKGKKVTFDLKCQWNKHMDKHERPYVCKAAGCEKLKGFTYAGGLLRHQREVHKMHGGSLFMCPVPYCKRNTALGFARKENLKEHMRRTHNNADLSSDPPATSPDTTTPEKTGGFSAINHSSYLQPTKKRRRTISSTPTLTLKDEAGDEDVEEDEDELIRLRKENARLRIDLKSRDDKISELETTIATLEKTISQIFAQSSQRNRV